jgi:hypothetical protein
LTESSLFKEAGAETGERLDKDCTIQIAIALFARCLGLILTGMAAGTVDPPAGGVRPVFRTQRIRSAQPHTLQRLLEMPPQSQGIAQLNKAAQRSFAVWGCGVEKNARHRAAYFIGSSIVEPSRTLAAV